MDDEEELPPIELSKCLKDRVPDLSSLVNALTCHICYDPFINPVLTGCSHTFCSLCIRKYLVYKQQCPQCGTLATDGQLRANKTAGESASILRDLVSSIENLVSSVPAPSSGSNQKLSTASQRVQSSSSDRNPECKDRLGSSALESKYSVPTKQRLSTDTQKKTSESEHMKPPAKLKPCTLDDSDSENVPASQLSAVNSQFTQPSATGSSQLKHPGKPSGFVSGLSLLQSPVREKQVLTNINENANSPGPNTKVECMICKVYVSSKNLPLHLNTCLEKQPRAEKPVAKRKPLPKLVYNLLKESELKKKCKEVGLSNKGDRRTLIARHQKYTVLYNSECELEKPRSKFELIRQVEREENAEKSGSTVNSLLKFDRNSDAKSIEEKQRKYIQQNKSSFSHLISAVKQKEMSRLQETDAKSSISSSQSSDVIVIDSDPVPSTSGSAALTNHPPASTSKAKESKIVTPNIPTTPGSTDEDINTSALSHQEKSEKRDYKNQSAGNSGGSKSVGIKESLARSAERNKTVEKQTCPVCQTLVVERYLNIHLDKCLRKNEPDPSPIIKKSATQTKKSSKKKIKIVKRPKFEDSMSSSDADDDIRPWETPPKKAKRKGVLHSDDEEFAYQWTDDGGNGGGESEVWTDGGDEAEGTKDSSVLVAEPSLTDLINMGLGTRKSREERYSFEEDDSVDLENDRGASQGNDMDASQGNYGGTSQGNNGGASQGNKGDASQGNDEGASQGVDASYLPLSNGLDQYTDNLSQESYAQGSESDIFASFDKVEEGDESFWDDTAEMDETLNNHIDRLADQYLGESPDKTPAKLQEEKIRKVSQSVNPQTKPAENPPVESNPEESAGSTNIDKGRKKRKRGAAVQDDPPIVTERRRTRRKL